MRVIGYTRVSTREQAKDGWTLAQQRKDIEREAERRGWELVEVIEDAGYSGTSDNRPGLQRALAMLAKRNGPEAIIIARLDRLARSTQNLCEYIGLSKRQRWSMIALDVQLDTTTATGRLMVRLLAAIAEWESEVNGDRVRDGMAEARASLKAEGKPVRFGFQAQVDNATVERILRARKRGDTFNAIARKLDAAGTPTPGGGARWYPSTVERICKREAVRA
jgi:DNA invertase Pin-like site-specific DNA recombinase